MVDEPLRAVMPVELPVHGNAGQLWSGLLDLADAKPHGWTLVGALMVMLHELEAGTSSGRATAAQPRSTSSRPRGSAHALDSLCVELHRELHGEVGGLRSEFHAALQAMSRAYLLRNIVLVLTVVAVVFAAARLG